MNVRWPGRRARRPRTAVEAPRLIVHPPERGRQLPLAAAAACGSTCCTSTCSSAHTIGGLLGAYVGATRAVSRQQSDAATRAAQRAVNIYTVAVIGLALLVLGTAGVFWLLMTLPAAQLVASLLAILIVVASAVHPRQPALDAILLITGWTFVYAAIGGAITGVFLLWFFK